MPAGWAVPLSSSTPWRFCFAPRAGSGRSGCTSSAALRPAFACDPALGGRRPAAGPLVVCMGPRQRYPTAGRRLETRTLRRHGSYRPRGGSHPHPRPQAERSRDPGTECAASMSLAEGWGVQSPGGWGAISPEAAGTRRADRGWGVGDAVSCGHRGVPGPERAVPPRAGLQPEESRSAASPACGGTSKRRAAAHPSGKKNHAVTQQKQAARPWPMRGTGSRARPRKRRGLTPSGSARPLRRDGRRSGRPHGSGRGQSPPAGSGWSPRRSG